jgi:hypothetical protein
VIKGPAAVATLCALAYMANKVHLALEGEVGIAGFYAKREANHAFDNSAPAQWANAVFGFALAMLCLALARPIRSRWLRLVVLISSLLGCGLIMAGVAGLTLRAVGLTGSTDWERTNWVSLMTLTIGWLWVVAWFVALVQHSRGRQGQAR